MLPPRWLRVLSRSRGCVDWSSLRVRRYGVCLHALPTWQTIAQHEGTPMSQLLSTDAVAPEHRLAYWTDLICTTYVQLE